MKMLGYIGEIERNFEVSSGMALTGCRCRMDPDGDVAQNDGLAGMGDARSIDWHVNPFGCGRVQSSKDSNALDYDHEVVGGGRTSWAYAGLDVAHRAGTRDLTRPEQVGHRRHSPMGQDRERGERS